jgi:CheY-like chemotaxis protein
MVVSVRDTGKGIDPEFLQHVFERFRQADSSAAREHGGLGLGLSIVKHLVEAHGGTTGVQSDGVGCGTTFTIWLPVSDRADDAADQSRTPTRSREISLAGVRILFVDDNPDTRTVLARVIADYGAEIATASSADEALELLRRIRPHILIADIGMPGKDGYELIRDVRRDPEHGRIPGVALTAFARTEDRVRALQAGFDMHVAKPIDPSELLTAVASLLRDGGSRSN